MMILTSGQSFFISAASVKPSMSGMRMSRNTTSGALSRQNANADLESPAVWMASSGATFPITLAKSRRALTSSSTISMFMLPFPFAILSQP